MIKKEELRYGNLVHKINRNGLVHLPDTIDLKIIELKTIVVSVLPREIPEYRQEPFDLRYSDLEPIPLVPEMLKICGFVKVEIFIDCDNFYYSYKNIKLFNDSKGNLYFNVLESNVRIEYLHQLQNLVFILIGEELKFDSSFPS